MFFLGRVSSTLVKDPMFRLAYLGVVRSLNFLYFLAGSGEMLFTPIFAIRTCLLWEPRKLLFDNESPVLLRALSNCINCPPWWMCRVLGAPVGAAAGDILRSFWKCFSPYLRAVVLRLQRYYNHLEGLLNHSLLGAALGEGDSVWDVAWEFAYPTSSQVLLLMLLVPWTHFQSLWDVSLQQVYKQTP